AVSPIASKLLGKNYEPDNSIPNVADALVSRNPQLLDLILKSLGNTSRGVIVNNSEILSAMEDFHRSGYLVEPSSATVLAAYRKYHGKNKPVLVLTGNGLKTIPVS
ncbi:MAG TPA: threonine synthase, partial [Thermoplasmataceae archaeon]|nr:threonine synthase [Thermoplasmataceae archaeon]